MVSHAEVTTQGVDAGITYYQVIGGVVLLSVCALGLYFCLHNFIFHAVDGGANVTALAPHILDDTDPIDIVAPLADVFPQAVDGCAPVVNLQMGLDILTLVRDACEFISTLTPQGYLDQLDVISTTISGGIGPGHLAVAGGVPLVVYARENFW